MEDAGERHYIGGSISDRQILGWGDHVVHMWIVSRSQLDHFRRDIRADDLFRDLSERPCRKPRAAADIDRHRQLALHSQPIGEDSDGPVVKINSPRRVTPGGGMRIKRVGYGLLIHAVCRSTISRNPLWSFNVIGPTRPVPMGRSFHNFTHEISRVVLVMNNSSADMASSFAECRAPQSRFQFWEQFREEYPA